MVTIKFDNGYIDIDISWNLPKLFAIMYHRITLAIHTEISKNNIKSFISPLLIKVFVRSKQILFELREENP